MCDVTDQIKHTIPPEAILTCLKEAATELGVKSDRNNLINTFRVMYLAIEKLNQQEEQCNIQEQKDREPNEENTEGIMEENMPGGMDGGSVSELSSDEDSSRCDADNGIMGG